MINEKNDISGNDVGFGTGPTVNNRRMLNKDGSSNVNRKGLPFFRTSDTYNSLITMSWRKFIGIVFTGYLIINAFFATVYLTIGVENLHGIQGVNKVGHFFDAFFFSAQTVSTVGYGHIYPVGILTSSVAAFESMLGLLAFALATGLLYGRFSRPYAKIIYSNKILVSPYQNGTGLMFRMANYRRNQLIELEVQLLLSLNVEEAGKKVRKFLNLELERSRIQLLTLSWTVVHPVVKESPIYGLNLEDLKKGNAEFLVMIKAFDDTFSQTVHSRTSYHHGEIVWGAKFVPVFAPDEKGILTLDLGLLDVYREIN